MNKYRIKLLDERVIGPFTLNQVGELFLKNKLSGEEVFQKFPAGDWGTSELYPELENLFNRIISGKITDTDLSEPDDNTRAKIIHAKKARIKKDDERQEEVKRKKDKVLELEKKAKLEEFQEFKFDKETKTSIDYDALEKEAQEKIEKREKEKVEEEEEKKPEIEATRIISKNILEEVEKTVVVNPQALEDLKNEDDEASEEAEEASESGSEEEEVEEEVTKSEVISQDEATLMVSLKDLLPTSKDEAKETEKAMKDALEESTDESEELKKAKEKKNKKNKKENKEEKKKMKPIVAFAMIVIIYMLLNPSEEETKKGIEPVKYRYSPIITKPVANETKAMELYNKGKKYYDSGTYKNRILAAESFKNSLQEKFEDNPSLGMLILTYGELFKNASDKKVASKQMFRLVQLTRAKVYKEINIAIGTALFYYNAGKSETAINIFENFTRLSSPSVKLFSHYMDIVIELGDLVKARKIYDSLLKAPSKTPETYLSFSKYFSLDERFDEGRKILVEGIKKYPSSVALLLEYCKYLLRDQDIKELTRALKRIEELRAEDNPEYFAKYLEYTGMLSAINGDNKTATALFKKSLAIFESDSLRSKLASLDIGGDVAVENLIKESKVIDLIRQSQKYAKARNWEDAYKAAIGAVDLLDTYIPAKLHLAKLQIERGYYESALKSLTELKEDNALNPQIYLLLIKANIEARKFGAAKTEINAMSSNAKLVDSYEFASLWGDFYKMSKNEALALNWYNRAISRNPLADIDHYKMGRIFFENGHFKKAKQYFQSAITLDPINLTYQVAYSDVLFELEGAVTAISYLRDLLEDFVDNPKLLGKIAIYYYRNGEIKPYERMRNDIEELGLQDPDLYKFLIKVGEIEGDSKKVIENTEKLLELTPSDVRTWMQLAQTYYNVGMYNDGVYATDQIISRLKSYPRTHYYRAKINIKLGKLDSALEDAEQEIKFNPEIYEGYYVQGEVYRLKGDMGKALKSLEKAVTKDPKSVETLMAMGWIKLAQRYYEQARDLYMRAKAREQDNPQIRRSLGIIYQKIGQSKLALEEFEIYLKLDPGAKDRKAIEANIRALR